MMEEILLSLCTAFLTDVELDGSTLSDMSEMEMDRMLSFATEQGVLPVAVAAIERYCPDFHLYSSEAFLAHYGVALKMRQQYLKRQDVMRRLSDIFLSSGIDMLYLKGATLSGLYPDPTLRCSSDIDFYLYGRSREGVSALERAGIDSTEYAHHHTQAMMDGVLLENHYDFFDRRNHRHNLILDDKMKMLADTEGRRIPFEFKGSYAPTPTMNAIFLMTHMSIHFVGETVTLRQLYDWALFLIRHSSSVDWNLVKDTFTRSDLMRFAGIIQTLVIRKLHIEVLCPIETVEDNLTERVWDSVVHPSSPNCARKNSVAYWARELKVFLQNGWKHHLVYPEESYLRLFFRFAWPSAVKLFKKR